MKPLLFYIFSTRLAGMEWRMPFLVDTLEAAKSLARQYRMKVIGEINAELNPPKIRYYAKRAGVLTAVACIVALICGVNAEQPVCKLAWDPSPDTNVTTTVLYWGTNSRSYFASNSYPAGVTNAAISNLTVGVVYYFAATAVNQYGVESEYSNEVWLLNKIKSKARVRIIRLHNGGQIRGP